MNFKTLLLLLALSCLSLVQPAFSQEKVFSDLNCALTIPEGWNDVTENMKFPGMIVAYAKPDQTEIIFLTANKQGSSPDKLDDKFITEFERGIADSGGTVLAEGKIVEMAGLKAYQRTGNLNKNGRNLSSKTLAIPTKDYFYALNTLRFEGPATEAPELEKVFSSFRFLTPVQEPGDKSAAFKIGYMAGYYGVYILAGLVLIAGVVALFFLLRRK